jgi:hypothetical protein
MDFIDKITYIDNVRSFSDGNADDDEESSQELKFRHLPLQEKLKWNLKFFDLSGTHGLLK